MVAPVLTVVVGYLLGTLPTALLVGKRAGVDPRRAGSGNPGASNVYRTVGRRAASIVLGVDVVKGAAAAGLGWGLGGHTLGLVAGAAAVVGHSFPIGRRGGKGVATCAGMLVVLIPVVQAVDARQQLPRLSLEFQWAHRVAGVRPQDSEQYGSA